MSKRQIQMELPLHRGQQIVHQSNARFKVINCGRRWGKTHLAWIECLIFLLQHPGSLVWWVAPLYKELVPITRKVQELTPPECMSKKLESQGIVRFIRFINNSEIWFHSADKEDSLRGVSLDGMVLEEAAQLKEQRWHGELEPSLMDKNGWVLFISTPKGRNWFHRLYGKGQDPGQSLYQSWSFSSYDNAIENGGFIPKASIDSVANDMPEMLRRQEIFGVFLEGEGAVFRNIRRQVKDVRPYMEGDKVYIGVDLAKTSDYTVLVAMRDNGDVVGFDRFSQLDWVFQQSRILEFAKKYNGAVLLDSTGLGDPIYDSLSRQYNSVQGYKFTNQSKKELIENLSIMFDQGALALPNIPVLVNELELFAYDIGQSGLIRYEAPSGCHDDCVIALALAAWLKKSVPSGEIEVSYLRVKK